MIVAYSASTQLPARSWWDYIRTRIILADISRTRLFNLTLFEVKSFAYRISLKPKMDPLSLTTGIITLYGTCMKIFVFFTDVNNADKTAAKALRTLEIRSSALKSWGHYWEIQENSGSSQKLKNYMDKNVSKGNAVQLSLEAIADTLSDREKLLKSFGVKVDPKGFNVKVSIPIKA